MDIDLSRGEETDDGHGTAFSRRTVLKGASVTAGAGSIGALGLWYGSRPAMAAHVGDWTAGNTELVQSDDGTLTAVNTAPAIDIEWSNFAAGADSFDVTLTAHLRAADNGHIDTDKSDVVYHETAILDDTSAGVAAFDETTHDGDLGATNGGSTVTLDQIDITNVFDADASGETEDVTEADFEDSDSSTANQITTVELQLQTVVNGAQSANPTNDLSTTFDVEVENLAETSTTGGDGGTTAE